MDTAIPHHAELKACPLLADLTDDELGLLSTDCKIREYDEQNPVICEEGQVGDGFFIIMEGQVRVFKKDNRGKEHLLAVLKGGDFFGEMALLDMEMRSASCHALEPAKVIWIGRTVVDRLRGRGEPMVAKLFFRMLMDVSNRLRLLNERYVYMRSCYTGGRM
ncbi:MAG: cyclic nucleotide-binding domain-containing protein [Candidatus Riflebacteria bacterium]|nr:cyclic nucleotide-binding domain-containing protein [Candidatus Riflebacteria bacterium]